MRYSIKSVKFSDGERFFNLFSADSIPMYWPTLWTLSEYRGTGKSINTIESALRSVKSLYGFLDESEINLEKRLNEGLLLSMDELEGLINYLRYYTKKNSSTSKVINLKKKRFSAKSLGVLSHGAFAARLIYVSSYLSFRVDTASSKLNHSSHIKISLAQAKDVLRGFFKARSPKNNSNGIDDRQGLEPTKLQALRKVSQSSFQRNAWKRDSVRFRNELIINLLIETGIRRGELLNIKVEDINFQSQTLKILRRPGDPSDSRLHQPLVKTRSREIPISPLTCEALRIYVFEYRAGREAAKKHGFLFTSTLSGKPLSLKSCNAIFDKIRSNFPELSEGLHPHILRHTWNDIFSERADASGVSEDMEKKLRAELMGWSPTSDMPSHYTKRHIRKKAKEILEKQQEKALRDLDE